MSMDKLPHFQKQHTRRLLAEDPPNIPLLTEHLVVPARTIIENTESTRLETDSAANSDLGALGALVPSMDSALGNPEDYILKALKISRSPASDLEDVVRDNRYLFWTVPRQVLENRSNAAQMENLALEKSPATAAACIGFLETEFKNRPGPWMAENLNAILKKISASITFQDTTSGRSVGSGGYNFLRWALCGRDNGPALGDVMDLLGREETMRRLELARKVASD